MRPQEIITTGVSTTPSLLSKTAGATLLDRPLLFLFLNLLVDLAALGPPLFSGIIDTASLSEQLAYAIDPAIKTQITFRLSEERSLASLPSHRVTTHLSTICESSLSHSFSLSNEEKKAGHCSASKRRTFAYVTDLITTLSRSLLCTSSKC